MRNPRSLRNPLGDWKRQAAAEATAYSARIAERRSQAENGTLSVRPGESLDDVSGTTTRYFTCDYDACENTAVAG